MVVAAKDEFIVLVKGTMAVVVHHQQDIVRGQLTELVESGGGAFDGPVHVDMVLGDLPAVVLEGFDQALALVFEGDVISCWRGHVILCSEIMKGPGENKAVDLFVLLSWSMNVSDRFMNKNQQGITYPVGGSRSRTPSSVSATRLEDSLLFLAVPVTLRLVRFVLGSVNADVLARPIR